MSMEQMQKLRTLDDCRCCCLQQMRRMWLAASMLDSSHLAWPAMQNPAAR